MRGVNIHADFVMIQCTKNKNLTPLSYPLCHPSIRRSSVNFYSIPPVPPLRGFTGATICRLAMRRGSEIPLAYGSRLRPAGFAEASAIRREDGNAVSRIPKPRDSGAIDDEPRVQPRQRRNPG